MNILKIELGIDKCEHLKDKSYYNHNFYRLESYGDWCSLYFPILLEECHEDENYYTFALGNFDEKGDFTAVLEWDSNFGDEGIKTLFRNTE